MSELKCENIGGLSGKHSFKFKKGLNILNAPNISGKTSIINAIRLSCEGDWDNEDLKPYLHNKANYGSVELLFNGKRQKVSLTRDKNNVRFLSREIDYKDKRTKNLSFLMKDSPLQIAIDMADIKEIRRWFYNITDIDYYEIAKTRSESVFRYYNQEKNNLEKQLEGSTDELQKLENEFLNEKDNLDAQRNDLLKSPELEEFQDKIDTLDAKIKTIDKEIGKLGAQLSENELNLNKAKKELDKKEKTIDEKKFDLEDVKRQLLVGENQINELEINYESNIEKIFNLEKEINGYDEVVENKTIHIEGIKEILSNYRYELKKKTSIQGLNNCPTCDSKLETKKIDERIETIKERIETNELFKRKRESELSELHKSQNIIKKQITEIEEELPNLKNEIDEEINTLNSEIKGYKGSITTLNNKISKTEKELNIKNDIKDNLKRELEELLGPYEEVKENLSSLNIKIEELTKKINDTTAKIKLFEEGTEEIKRIRNKVNLSEIIVRHFSNCVSRITQIMLDKLNKRLKESFQLLELAELDRILITEKFDIIITRKGGYETSIAELSGAERTLISFIIMVIAKNEFLPDFPILVIDETGEFMDKTRFLKMIEYLSEIIDILIITRNKPLKDKPKLISQEDIIHVPSEII